MSVQTECSASFVRFAPTDLVSSAFFLYIPSNKYLHGSFLCNPANRQSDSPTYILLPGQQALHESGVNSDVWRLGGTCESLELDHVPPSLP